MNDPSVPPPPGPPTEPLPAPRRPGGRVLLIGAAIVVVLAATGIFAAMSGEPSEETPQGVATSASPSQTITPSPSPEPSPTPTGPSCNEDEYVAVLARADKTHRKAVREGNQYVDGGAAPPKKMLERIGASRMELAALSGDNLAGAALDLVRAWDRALAQQEKLIKAARRDASLSDYNSRVDRANAAFKKVRRLVQRVLQDVTTPICLA